MRKYIAAIVAAAAVLSVMTACGKKVKKESSVISGTDAVTTESGTGQPDPLAPTIAPETTAPPETTEVSTEASTQVDPLGGGKFEYNKDGAVVFDGDPTEQSDRLLMAAAQALFESACRTEWKFTVDGPYDLDQSSYVENKFGWRFYKVKNAGINSLEDVKNDYCKVFCKGSGSHLSSYYMEQNGSVYAIEGARGGDIYYSASKITAVNSKSESELVFAIEHYYDGTGIDGKAPYSEKDTFTVKIEDGNIWRAAEFKLPY